MTTTKRAAVTRVSGSSSTSSERERPHGPWPAAGAPPSVAHPRQDSAPTPSSSGACSPRSPPPVSPPNVPLFHHRRRGPPADDQLRQQPLGNLAANHPVGDQRDQLCERRRRQRTRRDGLKLGRPHLLEHVPHHPVGRRLGVRPRRDDRVKVARRLGVVGEHPRVVRGEPQGRHVPRALGGRQLREGVPPRGERRRRQRQRRQVRLGEVAVVGVALLDPQHHRRGGLVVPGAGLLREHPARVEHRRLPRDLVLDAPVDGRKRVYVFELDLGAKRRRGERRRSDTFTSHRRLPSCMFPSEAPT